MEGRAKRHVPCRFAPFTWSAGEDQARTDRAVVIGHVQAVRVEDLGQHPVGGGDLRRLGLRTDAEDLVRRHRATTPVPAWARPFAGAAEGLCAALPVRETGPWSSTSPISCNLYLFYRPPS